MLKSVRHFSRLATIATASQLPLKGLYRTGLSGNSPGRILTVFGPNVTMIDDKNSFFTVPTRELVENIRHDRRAEFFDAGSPWDDKRIAKAYMECGGFGCIKEAETGYPIYYLEQGDHHKKLLTAKALHYHPIVLFPTDFKTAVAVKLTSYLHLARACHMKSQLIFTNTYSSCHGDVCFHTHGSFTPIQTQATERVNFESLSDTIICNSLTNDIQILSPCESCVTVMEAWADAPCAGTLMLKDAKNTLQEALKMQIALNFSADLIDLVDFEIDEFEFESFSN